MIDEDCNNDELTTLFRKSKSLSLETILTTSSGRYSWVEEIEDERLTQRLKKLSQDDLELLTLLVFDGFSQAEIAEQRACSQKAISKKYIEVKLFLKSGSKK